MLGRSCALLFSLIAAPALGAPLTEADVIRWATENDPAAILARAEAELARAETIGPGLYPNPSIEWEREALLGADRAIDDFLRLEVPLAFSPRRAARSALARASMRVAEGDSARATTAAVVSALETFYAVAYAARRIAILEELALALDEAARILARKEEQGTASGYERARLDLEAELARSDLRAARGDLAITRRMLLVVLGRDDSDRSLEVTPEVTTTEPAPIEQLLDRARSRRASLRSAKSALEEAERAQAKAALAWIPDAAITAGARRNDEAGSAWGYVAGARLEIPLTSRGQDVSSESDARVRLEAARLARAERAIRIEVLTAHERLAIARRELELIDGLARTSLDVLVQAAESGYREGARSIVELLDAQRARRELELRRWEWLSRAKNAEIALRAAVGEFE